MDRHKMNCKEEKQMMWEVGGRVNMVRKCAGVMTQPLTDIVETPKKHLCSYSTHNNNVGIIPI